MVGVCIYAGIIAFLELNYLKLAKTDFISNVGMMHGVLGFVISLLLVFRTNTAYDRWWEGRKLWGNLNDSARNLAIKVNGLLSETEEKRFFRSAIPTYAFALKSHLRESHDFSVDPVLDLSKDKHLPNQIVVRMFGKLAELHQRNVLSTAEMMVLDAELRIFTQVCGGCERIKNTPIPFTYSVFIKKFIFFYVMTLPFGWVFSLGYYIIPVIALILYAFASLELIAEEIENPFGTDANDLPIDQICHNIRKHVNEIID